MTRNSLERVARLSQIPDDGTTIGVTRSNGDRICLIRQGSRITAVHDICTHQEFSMSSGDVLPDGTIQCAWHGARFDCATGEVKQSPATKPLPVYEVVINGEDILVGGVRSRSGKGFEPSVGVIRE